MKKQINPTIKAHLIRGAFYLLLLLAVCAIPFALAQRNATRRSVTNSAAKTDASTNKYMAQVSHRTDGAVSQQPLPRISQTGQSQLPNDVIRVPANSPLLAPASAFRVPAAKLPNAKGRNGIVAKLLAHTPLFTYVIDDGTAEDSVGLTAGGTFVACNEFPVTGGNNVITSISIAWGTPAFPDPTLNGLPYTAVLWSDPNGDGSPTDAVVLAMAPGVISQQGTNTFITTTIPPTMVPTANFFVGFLITHTAGQFPAALDESAPIPNRSWVDVTSNINDLSGSITIESAGLPGNWLIRADGNTGGPTPTGTPSPTPTATINPCATYNTTTGTGTITPGTTDTGNHCDDCVTAITFPFPVSVYGQTFNSANVASNGSLDLIGTQAPFTHACQVLPNTLWTMAILPYQDDLRTDNISFTGCNVFPGATCGVFTSTTGTAPNRHFNVEWRAVHFADTTTSVNFEVVFTENQSSFDVIYGATSDNGLDETSGVQASSTGPATTFSCGTATLTNGLKVTYMCNGGPSPTPTPTGTPSCTPAWQNEPAMTTARRNPATVVVGSNLYAITGFNAAPDYTAANESFNGTSWTTLAPIPVPHAQSRGTAVGTNIYVPGGFNSVSFGGPLDTMQIYNTTTNTWSAGMTMPGTRGGPATATFNGLVYVIAGYTTPFPTITNTVFIYNPGTNSYTMGAPMPAGQGNVAGVLFNGEIYVVGGGNTPGAQYAYNPTTNTWRTIAPMPTTGGTCQSDNGFVLNNELWVVGCLGLPINQQVWIYNAGSDSWRAGPQYNVDHQGPGAALFNGRGFVVGGGAAAGGSNAVESIGPCGPTPTPTTTPTASPSASATATPTAPATATPTASPSCTPVAGQITTLFASNNSGSLGGANYFDVTVAANSITVTALDINTAETVPFSNVRVYVLPGMTSVGNETNMALWTQVATGSGTGAGVDMPTHVTLSNSFVLNAGTLYGIAVVADPAITLHYTNGNGSNQNFSNADLSLALGSATNVPFTAPVFSPRVWNGTIYYTGGPCGGSPTPTPTPTATASCTPSSFNVLIAYSDIGGPPATLQSQILAEPGVTGVDLFDASSSTPTLAQLQPYNIVVAFSNNPYADPVGMGNVLADYADTGGIVVGLNFDWFGPPFGLDGRWITGGYTPFNTGPTNFTSSCLGTYDTTHPLMQGISAGSLCAFFRHTLTLSPGAVSVALYQDNEQLCAYKTNNGHTGIGINAYLGENPMNFSGPFGTVIVNAGRWLISGPCGTPSPTPTASGTPSPTPTCPPGGSPGPWTQAAPVAIDHYGGFMDSDGTFAYEGGGYSFSAGGTINQFGKFNPATNTWTPLAPVPDLTNAEASGVYAPNVNKLFVFGGDDPTTGTVVNTTRIYDIATNTWSSGTAMPDVRAFMASGYFNGKIYLVGGYSTGNVDPSFGQVWEYDPVANTFNTTRMSMPATLGGPGFGIINGHLYVAGGRDLNNTNLNTLYDYDIAANTWTTRANMPSGVNVPGSAVIAGKLWVFGGGNPFTGPGTAPTSASKGVRAWLKRLFSPDTTNSLQVYDPASNSWTSGPTLNQQRSFPAGTAVGNTAVAVGGYTGSSTTASVEINMAGGGCASPTPTVPPTATPTASPSCTPGGTPGPWSMASPYPITDVRYGFAQTATHFYVFGGVSNGTRVPDVNRLDLATGMWQSRAPMPFTSEAPTCALMASTGIVYCSEGDTGSGFASYNIATDTWTTLASDPFHTDHYGSASGAFNGKVFVAGGSTAFSSAVAVYDVATNTWSAGTAAPNDFLLAGYQQVGQFLYVVGGFEASGPVAKVSAGLSSVLNRGQQSKQPKVPMANNTTTWRLDMSSAPGVWTTGPAFTEGRADFGLAYDAGTSKLYALGGDLPGGGFFDSTNAVDELSVASWPSGTWMPSPPDLIMPNRQANQAGFYGSGQIWSVGGLVGQTFQFLAEVQHRSNGSGPCGTPTPTPTSSPTVTATATFTPTATATATAIFTPTATATATSTATATATATATVTPTPTPPQRPSPTPRPRPTPREHANANCFFDSSDCSGLPKTDTLTCFDCLVRQGAMSWLDEAGCHTTCQ